MLVLVSMMSVGGDGDGRNLLGDDGLVAADRHDGGHEPTSASEQFYFKNQISSNFLDKKVNAKKSFNVSFSCITAWIH